MRSLRHAEANASIVLRMSTLSDAGLYYPYVNFRSDAWIKAAILHWPVVGRMVPRDGRSWRQEDSDTVKQLRDELGVIVDVTPRNGSRISEDFFALLEANFHDLRVRYGLHTLDVDWSAPANDSTSRLDSQVDAVSAGKISYRLAEQLADAGLIRRARYGQRTSEGRALNSLDYVMHRRLAEVYMTLLADHTADANSMNPITDRPRMLATTGGWTRETLARLLLADTADAPEPTPDEIGQAFTVMAFQTVVPHDLEHVPVAQVIKVRKQLQPRLLEYREYLNSLSGLFAEIAELADASVREAQLRLKVEVEVTRRIEKMHAEIVRLSLKPVKAVLSLQTLAPPAVVGALATATGAASPITSVAVAAGCLVGASASALAQRKEVRHDHPVGYLLAVKNGLQPTHTVASVTSSLKRGIRKQV